MTAKTKSMFEAIKQSLTKKEGAGGNGLYKEILKFEPGKTYLVRLVPNQHAPKESIFHYFNHGWNSNATGKYVTALCPTTFGDTCPIDAYYLKTYRKGTEEEKEASKVLSRKENWMVNVYVISDPSNPENEGKVKILRYGRELDKVITSATEGDDVGEIGVERAFDVVEGCTLRIKCEHKTDKKRSAMKMVTYASSKFLNPEALDIDEDQLQAIYDSVHDLKAVNKQTTAADMQRMLDEHFFCLATGSVEEVESDTEDDTPAPAPLRNFAAKAAPTPVKEELNETDETTDEALKKLLADL